MDLKTIPKGDLLQDFPTLAFRSALISKTFRQVTFRLKTWLSLYISLLNYPEGHLFLTKQGLVLMTDRPILLEETRSFRQGQNLFDNYIYRQKAEIIEILLETGLIVPTKDVFLLQDDLQGFLLRYKQLLFDQTLHQISLQLISDLSISDRGVQDPSITAEQFTGIITRFINSEEELDEFFGMVSPELHAYFQIGNLFGYRKIRPFNEVVASRDDEC